MAWLPNISLHLASILRQKRGTTRNHPHLPMYQDSAHYITIRLPNHQILKLFSRLLLCTFLLASFPYISSFLVQTTSSNSSSSHHQRPIIPVSDSINLDHLLSLFFRDLTNEGLMKRDSHKSIFLSNGDEQDKLVGAQSLTNYNIHLIPLNDLDKQSKIRDESVDFIFTFSFPAASRFIDRTLKTGGVVTVLLNYNPSTAFSKPSNYKIAYMRRFDLTAVAMWKTAVAATAAEAKPHKQRKLLSGDVSEAKKAALQKLEDVLLEPPRSASRKSRRYLKRTRYLPDLMGDSLESYPRRIFIDVGPPEKDTDWFSRNYPTRNKDFEMYKIDTVTEESSSSSSSSRMEVPQIGVLSDWVRKNVKEEEYVVMKAEAEIVEEMMRSKAISLVDELFLECKPQLKKGKSKSGWAYWECLALYGRLRDEGVAVHQWWG